MQISPSPLIHPSCITPFEEGRRYLDFPLDFDDSGMGYTHTEVLWVGDFLHTYSSNSVTLLGYTKEMEKYLQWLWRIKQKSIVKVDHRDAKEFVDFLRYPPMAYISHGKPEGKYKNGVANKAWRPFTSKLKGQFNASHRSIGSCLLVVGKYYKHAASKGWSAVHPFLTVKNPIPKAKSGDEEKILEARVAAAKSLALTESKYLRTWLITAMMCDMKLKATDLANNGKDVAPLMRDFRKEGPNWTFYLKGQRHIVSKRVMEALKAFRKGLDLPPLPQAGEETYLLPALKAKEGANQYLVRSQHLQKLLAAVDGQLKGNLENV